MGHIVSHEGVNVEPNKIKAMKERKIKSSSRIYQVGRVLS